MRIKWYVNFLNGEVFSIFIVRFSAKKSENLENIENMMSIFEKKKRFHPFKRHLYQNGKAENMPVVAGRLVVVQPSLID